MEQVMDLPRVIVGGIEYPKGIAFPVMNGLLFLRDNFGISLNEMVELYKRVAAQTQVLAKEEKYDLTYKNDDHFKDGPGYVVLAKVKKVGSEYSVTSQFNIYTENNMVSLTIIADPGKATKDFITIGF